VLTNGLLLVCQPHGVAVQPAGAGQDPLQAVLAFRCVSAGQRISLVVCGKPTPED
jgi:hypothetical protein